ncbi:MAG TPA: TetR/AcrR family transcriptional regulator [Actinocrinis sp.]|nr:TetR/AcrR family transcriptional regulator [Actinocrinis sp.]
MNAHAGAAKADPNAEPASESGRGEPGRGESGRGEPGRGESGRGEARGEAGRGRYHHGDLANALTGAAVALAREGGPDAVVLREAARRVGVSPAAAYRHFAGHDELRYAVKLRAQQELADAMDAAMRDVEPMADPAPEALRRLGAIGAAYVHFALDEPGLFRTAFCHTPPTAMESDDSARASGNWHGPMAGGGGGEGEEGGEQGPKLDGASAEVNDMLRYRPFQMLSEGLDRLVTLGILRPERRPNAEIPAWSMVHGLATLLLDGPLQVEDEAATDALLELALRTIVDGLLS